MMIGFSLTEGRSQYILIGLEIRFKEERFVYVSVFFF